MENIPKVWTWVFVFKDKKFLIWKRKSSFWDWTWCLPWGHLEFWETFEECGKREAKEEFNIEIKDIEFLGISNDFTETKHYVTIFMVSKYNWGEINLTIFDEFTEWKWINLEELPSNLFPIFKNFLDKNVELVRNKISEL